MKAIASIASAIFTVLIPVFLIAGPAKADPEKLGYSMTSASAVVGRNLARLGVGEKLQLVSCLEGGKEKRTVCTHKLGDKMTVMISSTKGDRETIESSVFICGAGGDLSANAKCLLAFAALMIADTPEMTADNRGTIVSGLLHPISVSNSTKIQTDERIYSLDKAMGLWMTISAVSAAE